MSDFRLRGRVPGRLGDVGQEKFSKDGIFSRRGRSEDVELFAFVVNGLERQEISQRGGGGDVNFRRALINKCGRRFFFVHKERKIQQLVVVVDETILEKGTAARVVGVIVESLRSGTIAAHRRV